MKNRQTPCVECRQHRRKCIRTISDKCSRCERLDKICVQPPENLETCTQNYFQEREIIQLEWAMEQLDAQLQTLSCRRNNSSLSKSRNNNYTQELIQNLVQHWSIEIKNGNFHIETGIKTLKDLLYLQSSVLSYLSPFSGYGSADSSSGSEDRLVIHFGHISTTQPQGIVFYELDVTIDQLVSTYFSCHNTFTATLHKTSFLEGYQQLKNPASDLLTLSICSYVCSAPCSHIYHSPWERRKMADHYFTKARSIILEQFDMSEKRLENMISINLLSKYLQMTLKYQECRKLITIGYQICLDLKPDYQTLFDENIPNESVQCLNEERLNRLLYSRHFILTMSVHRLTNNIFDIAQDLHHHLPEWEIMGDELPITKKFIRAQNWFLVLFNHPYIEQFMNQTQGLYGGEVCTLSFELIIRMEDVLLEWGASIPDEFNLCGNLKNYAVCKLVVSESEDCIALMVFIRCQIFLVTIYSRLLQPISQGYYKLTACEFFFQAIDALMILSTSPNRYIAKESRESVNACLEKIDQINETQGFFVLPENPTPIDFSDKSKFNFKYYNQYPQPWCAMMYDATRYIISLS
ncbi:hypothetical protein INT48_004220 [Thamnidium elegans]|uniref:Zn(2)-C6 fungal-type domain-containing protein n=1 Tax=Thamnidium elegans TaxID=101142 RepID=A0A8H7VUX5_9FUNG|nr:hypothetical protein INT48_004220 [Thamnidium elegans]